MLQKALERLKARNFKATMTTTNELAVDFKNKDQILNQLQFRERNGRIEYAKMNHYKIDNDKDYVQPYSDVCASDEQPSEIVSLVEEMSNYKTPD